MKAALLAHLATLWSMLSAAGDGAGYDTELAGKSRARQAGTVISVVVIGVVALIGILIFARVNEAIPALNDSPLSDSLTSVEEGFGNAIEFVPIVMLVLLASVVIAVVQRMRT